MRVAVYPGTFDPPTLGHRDIIARAARLADRLVVGVAESTGKAPLFSLEERLALVREAAGEDVAVAPFTGLLIDFARVQGAALIVRGLRAGSDFDYEYPMAGMNRAMAGEVDTAFLMAAPALQPISSSLVREIARAGGSVEQFVTPAVARAIRAKVGGE